MRMWAWSRKTAWGSFTWARATFASPGLAVTRAINLGLELRLTEPFSCSERSGLNGSAWQPPTWKGVLRAAL